MSGEGTPSRMVSLRLQKSLKRQTLGFQGACLSFVMFLEGMSIRASKARPRKRPSARECFEELRQTATPGGVGAPSERLSSLLGRFGVVSRVGFWEKCHAFNVPTSFLLASGVELSPEALDSAAFKISMTAMMELGHMDPLR